MEKFPLEIFIFSFNRGRVLTHCLNSVLRHIPQARVTVVDDNSTDPVTRDVLQNLPDQVKLLQPRPGKGNKYGGLYQNLQEAYERAEAEFILFTQDDAQVVREFDNTDIEYIRGFFNSFPNAAFLNPLFRLSTRRSRRRKVHFSEEFPTFFHALDERFRDRSMTMYYTDIMIASKSRLQEVDWHFQQNERTTAFHARKHFTKMGCMVHPFLCQLPEVPAYRSGQKTWAMRQISKKQGGKICGFRDMTSDEVASLRSRPQGHVPYADEWLHCTGRKPKRPLRHKVDDAYPLLKQFHKLELKLRQ